MSLLKKYFMGMALWMLFPFLLFAQLQDPSTFQRPTFVTFEIVDAPSTIQSGEIFNVTVRATIKEKWHLYSIKPIEIEGPKPNSTTFSSGSNNLAIAGDIIEPDPEVSYDPNFDVELGWHSNTADFIVPVALRPELQGEQAYTINVRFQACDDRSCLAPTTEPIEGTIELAGVSSTPFTNFENAAPLTQENIPLDTSTSDFSGNGFLSFIWIALTAGFASLLTPCVFPMIPLTISFFSKESEGQKSSGGVGKALVFGLVIIATFTVLGALLSAILGVSGANFFAQDPFVNLFIGLILLLFAFSLLGMYEIRLPHKLTNWLNKKSNESSGVIGILFMALTISAVSFSCTAPFVGAVLAATAGGEWFYPIMGMIAYSAAFASPFVLFAMFPKWLESLPKSGSWMNMVKVLLGFIELGAAIKFISNADLVWQWNVVSRPLAIAIWITVAFLAGLYILGTYTLNHDTKPERIGTGRLLLSIPFLLFSFYLIPGLLGSSLGIWDAWLPPKRGTDVSLVGSLQAFAGSGFVSEEEGWSEDYEASLVEAKNANMPIFIDFTGYTCTNCRAMETSVFPLPNIQERFDRMVKVRLYTDDAKDGEKHQMFQFRLTGNISLPTYTIVDPNTGSVLTQSFGYTDESDFEEFLDEGLQKFYRGK